MKKPASFQIVTIITALSAVSGSPRMFDCPMPKSALVI